MAVWFRTWIRLVRMGITGGGEYNRVLRSWEMRRDAT